ncbi:MAG: DUF3347 domain-containing protein [Candidatus Cyclobacteriaceae bacterium M2_1C_046]
MRTKTILAMALALVSFGAFAQHDHGSQGDKKEMDQKMEPTFKDKNLGTAYGHYIHLKDALVGSNQEEAKNASAELVKTIHSVKGGDKAHTEAVKVAGAKSLDDQRKAFASLSNEMTTLVKDGELSMGEVYLEYCPMANNNTGAYWLSNQKEIKNPYFGDKMLKCGSVKETIK